MIIILSQGRKLINKCEAVSMRQQSYPSNSTKWMVVSYINSEDFYILGTYVTKERAKEIVEAIWQRISSWPIEGIPSFQMPEE